MGNSSQGSVPPTRSLPVRGLQQKLSSGGGGNANSPARSATGINSAGAPPALQRVQAAGPGLGVWMLAVYIVSGYATDIMLHLAGAKPYLSTVTGVAVALLYLASGRAFRAWQTTQGKLWLFLTIWLVIDIPFSHWPGGSYELLSSYLPKIHVILLFMCALAIRIEDCRVLIYAIVTGSFALLFESFAYGAADDSGRFCIPDSIVFSNPNDLGLQLVFCVGFFVYLMLNKGWISRFFGIAGFTAGFYYMLKTGSRGSLVACGAMALFCVLFTKYRFKVVLLALPLSMIVVSMPGDTLHRLTLILLNPTEGTGATAQDEASIESQMERQELLRASIHYMFTHPVFGVGPGQFSDFRYADMKQSGKHVASLGTHNSYTQIGAECGIPAFLCFAGVVLVSIRSNYRLYKQSERDPELQSVNQMAFCMTLVAIGYGVNAVFHHNAYSAFAPTLGGLSSILYLAATPIIQARQQQNLPGLGSSAPFQAAPSQAVLARPQIRPRIA